MLIVVAPAAIDASTSLHRKSGSERPASSGENSMLSVYSRAQPIDFTACASTCSGVIRNFIFMWIGELARNMCRRPDLAPLSASPARRTSFSLARASAHTVLFLIALAMALTAAKSPFEEAGKPASITSTFSRSSCLAMRIFSSLVIDAPGLCSPSRKVVSNMIKWSFMLCSCMLGRRFLRLALPDEAGYCKKGLFYLRAGRSSSRPPRMAVEDKRGKSRELLIELTIAALRGERKHPARAWPQRWFRRPDNDGRAHSQRKAKASAWQPHETFDR